MVKASKAPKATEEVVKINRSEYIRNKLSKNPNITAKEVNESFAKDHPGEELNPTLYYLVKSKEGGSKPTNGAKRGRKPGKKSSVEGLDYVELESNLDEMLFQARQAGDEDLVEALRTARQVCAKNL